ncbi:hypothetical protein SGRI78S_03844 [Streptomyces griseus subsp. griseus]
MAAAPARSPSAYRSSTARSRWPGATGRRASAARRRAAVSDPAGAGTVSDHSRGWRPPGHHSSAAAARAVASAVSVTVGGRLTVRV